jgi:hypothetical protein
MNLIENKPYREFKPSSSSKIVIKDCGILELNDDEQITFIKDANKKYDFTAKEWGFYVTPSINRRLLNEGFKTALVKNNFGDIFIMVVEIEKIDKFSNYCNENSLTILNWLNEWEKTKKLIP